MYVRLAFAVAAHLDPDILLLDEVLAVGDAAFQRKCMTFARSLEKKGSTILFVSHNMYSIKTMCQRVIYLKKGKVVFDGPTAEGLKLYEDDSRMKDAHWFWSDDDERPIKFTGGTVESAAGVDSGVLGGFTRFIELMIRSLPVVAVAALGPSGQRAPYSTTGPEVRIAAPGGDKRVAGGGVLQDTVLDGGGLAELQGTSMATPHVSGAVAALIGLGLALAILVGNYRENDVAQAECVALYGADNARCAQ
jgi:hypothetical protein